VGSGGLEALADLGGEVAGRDLLDVLDGVDAEAVEVEGRRATRSRRR
jgi:hypothetical protein